MLLWWLSKNIEDGRVKPVVQENEHLQSNTNHAANIQGISNHTKQAYTEYQTTQDRHTKSMPKCIQKAYNKVTEKHAKKP